MLHIQQTFLHNDKLEKKIFPMLSKVAWTKKVPFGTITCAHTCTQSQAWVCTLPAKLPRETRWSVQGRDRQSLGVEKLSAKTSPDVLTPWLLLGESKSGVKIPLATFSKCTAQSAVAFVLYPISLCYYIFTEPLGNYESPFKESSRPDFQA